MSASVTMKVFEILAERPEWFLMARNVSYVYSESGRAKALQDFATGRVLEVLEEEEDPRIEVLDSKDVDWQAMVVYLRTKGIPY